MFLLLRFGYSTLWRFTSNCFLLLFEFSLLCHRTSLRTIVNRITWPNLTNKRETVPTINWLPSGVRIEVHTLLRAFLWDLSSHPGLITSRGRSIRPFPASIDVIVCQPNVERIVTMKKSFQKCRLSQIFISCHRSIKIVYFTTVSGSGIVAICRYYDVTA